MAIARTNSAKATFVSGTGQTLAFDCMGGNALYANIGIVGSVDLLTGATYNGVALTFVQKDYYALVNVYISILIL